MTEKDRYPKEKQAKKFGIDKPDYSILEKCFLDAVSLALGEGKTKYGRDNWKKGRDWNDWFAAACRHLYKAKDVSKYDSEAKNKRVTHLGEAAANILFMIWQEENSKDPKQRNPRP